MHFGSGIKGGTHDRSGPCRNSGSPAVSSERSVAGSSFPLRGRRDFSRHFIIKVLIIPCTSGAGSRGGPTTGSREGCGSFLQTVQHFCHSRQQKCCTVCTLRQFSADSTALLLPRVAKVLYCLQKMACMCRQHSTFATPKCKSAVLSAQNPQNLTVV